MKLYSYVVARDYGFAPNPFFGVCTLATCKPDIREHAQVGDWVIGTGSKRHSLDGHLVYAMKVAETHTYDQYWENPRFSQKKPNLGTSLKYAFGDNIYHHHPKTGKWLQENSHHSLPNGRPNPANIKHDTQTPRVLLGTVFGYWGREAPGIPARFRRDGGTDVCCQHPGHKCNFPIRFVQSFVNWIESLNLSGYAGRPSDWR